MHDAAYTTLLRQDRRRLHQAVGEVLEANPAALGRDLDPVLGRHFFESGDLERAARYFCRAAKSAAAQYAHAEALSYYTQAIEAVQAAPGAANQRPAELFLGRGQVRELQGNFDAARSDYECAVQAAQAAGSLPDEWQAALALALLWAQRDYDRSGDYCQQALELAQRIGDPILLARSYNRLGNWRMNILQAREAAGYHQQALEIFQHLNDEPGMAETLDLLGMSSMLGGRLVRAAGFYQQAIDLNRRRGDKLALAMVLTSQLLTGSANYQTVTLRPSPMAYRDMLAQGEQALSLMRESGSRPGEVFASFVLAFYSNGRGNYARALPAARGGLEMATAISHQQFIAACSYALAIILLDLLALDASIEHLKTGLAISHQIGSRHWITTHIAFLAHAWVEAGNLDEAERVLAGAGSLRQPPQAIGERAITFSRAILANARGSFDSALSLITELLDSSEETAPDAPAPASPRLLLQRGNALAGLGRLPEAQADYETGLALAAKFGERPSQWRLHAAVARLLETQGRPAEADAQRELGRQMILSLAAGVPEPDLRATFEREALRRLAAHA